jgi:hypothetical protein
MNRATQESDGYISESRIALGLLVSAGILAILTPRVKKLMGTVR